MRALQSLWIRGLLWVGGFFTPDKQEGSDESSVDTFLDGVEERVHQTEGCPGIIAGVILMVSDGCWIELEEAQLSGIIPEDHNEFRVGDDGVIYSRGHYRARWVKCPYVHGITNIRSDVSPCALPDHLDEALDQVVWDVNKTA